MQDAVLYYKWKISEVKEKVKVTLATPFAFEMIVFDSSDEEDNDCCEYSKDLKPMNNWKLLQENIRSR